MTPLISIVVPVYNEFANLEPFFARLNPLLARLGDRYRFEFVFTDNHSTDGTFDRLADVAKADLRVRAYRFSRNFGYQRSILTGYKQACGDAAIQLDVDLQDPPELLETFLKHWESGYKVVYGIRRSRQETPWLHAIRKLFYRGIAALSDVALPLDAGDFRLLDREVLNQLREIHDARPYLRGIIAESGFAQLGVPYDRAERVHGESKFNFAALVQLALDGVVGHSTALLRLASIVGVFVCAASILGLIGYGATRLAGAAWPAGFTTTTMLILFGLGMNAIFLGIIGEYVGRIYLEVRRRPVTIVERVVGC